jgi:hypothetical protein
MPAAVVTINTITPQLDKKFQETTLIARGLSLAAQAIQQAGGTVTSGNINNDGGVLIGSWTYTPAASS